MAAAIRRLMVGFLAERWTLREPEPGLEAPDGADELGAGGVQVRVIYRLRDCGLKLRSSRWRAVSHTLGRPGKWLFNLGQRLLSKQLLLCCEVAMEYMLALTHSPQVAPRRACSPASPGPAPPVVKPAITTETLNPKPMAPMTAPLPRHPCCCSLPGPVVLSEGFGSPARMHVTASEQCRVSGLQHK